MDQGAELLWKFWSRVPSAASLWAFQALLGPGGQAAIQERPHGSGAALSGATPHPSVIL